MTTLCDSYSANETAIKKLEVRFYLRVSLLSLIMLDWGVLIL